MSAPKSLILFLAVALLGLIAFALFSAGTNEDAQLTQPMVAEAEAPMAPKVIDLQPQPDMLAEPETAQTASPLVDDDSLSADDAIPETLETLRELGAGAEQALITTPSGMRFEMTKTLMDDVHFDELLTALDSDLVGLDLEAGLLPLIYESAGEDEITVDKLACGEKVCALRLYGPTRDALESYFAKLTVAAEGTMLSKNWEDREAPGWVERRVIFATDQSMNGFLFGDTSWQ
ncbi:MAG: hypothetical protein AAF578_11690 [Pseudomonadota bacterium]